MGNRFLLILFFSLLLAGTSQAQAPDTKIREHNIPSAILKQEVTLMVRLPDGYETSQKSYPVLYFLNDNDKSLGEITTIVQQLHREKRTPEFIVVGIDVIDEHLDRMSEQAKDDRFLSYVERELMPEIGKHYRVSERSVFYETSLTGSLALYAFLTKPTLFNGYIAATKEWYEPNNDYFNGLADKALQNPAPYKGRKIFLATLNGAYNNHNIPEVDSQMKAFAKRLETKSGGNITAGYKAFDDWGISPQPGFGEGLWFVAEKEKATKSKPAPLTMSQAANGKWVIIDSHNTTLYEVFPFDNGPDYPSEGLIRIVKNGKIGYASAKTYAIVIAPLFDCAYPFEKGKAKVSNQCKTVKEGEHSTWTSDNWQYIDKKGKFRN